MSVPKHLSSETGEPKELYAYRNSKYKDAKPEDTVSRIRTVLSRYGIPVEETILSSGIDEICSCRISIRGTRIGQNGKGTSLPYALASGYAEFIERLSAGFLFPFRAPDGADLTVDQEIEHGGQLLTRVLSEIYEIPEEQIRPGILLEPWCENGKFTCCPFTSLRDGSRAFLPEELYRDYVFTDGSCCGNTREEALVQGLSEIMERCAAEKILRYRLTPPCIPEDYLRDIPELFSCILQLKEKNGCRVTIFDASLGKRLPVAGVLLTDPASGRAGIRFGAHPRFEVALERTLTELLQGRSSGDPVTEHRFGPEYEPYAASPYSIFNIIKGANGYLSRNLVCMESLPGDWEYTPFEDVRGDNSSFLQYLLSLCEDLHWDVYVRDCSFFDFPAYQVVVPQSLMLNFGKLSQAQNQEKHRNQRILRNLPQATDEEWKKALRTMKLFSGFAVHESLNFVAGIPFGCRLFGWNVNYTLLRALYSIHQKDYFTAARGMENYRFLSAEFRQLYNLCARAAGLPAEADCLDKEACRQAERIFTDPYLVLPSCALPDCSDCRRKTECEYNTVMQSFECPGSVCHPPVTMPCRE